MIRTYTLNGQRFFFLRGIMMLCLFNSLSMSAQEQKPAWELNVNSMYFINEERYDLYLIRRIYAGREKAWRFNAVPFFVSGGNRDLNAFLRSKISHPSYRLKGRIGHEWMNSSGRFTFSRGVDFTIDFENFILFRSPSGLIGPGVDGGNPIDWFLIKQHNYKFGISGFLSSSYALSDNLHIRMESHLHNYVDFFKYQTDGYSEKDEMVRPGSLDKGTAFVSEIMPVYFLGITYKF